MSKSKRVKARRMFAIRDDNADSFYLCGRRTRNGFPGQTVFVLPADTASYDKAVEQVCEALYMDDTGSVKGRAARWKLCQEEQGAELWFLERKAKAVLAAISITRPTTKEGKQS